MEQMSWDDLGQENLCWNELHGLERAIVLSFIAEFVAQCNAADMIDKPWNELDTQQRAILLSRGVSGD